MTRTEFADIDRDHRNRRPTVTHGDRWTYICAFVGLPPRYASRTVAANHQAAHALHLLASGLARPAAERRLNLTFARRAGALPLPH